MMPMACSALTRWLSLVDVLWFLVLFNSPSIANLLGANALLSELALFYASAYFTAIFHFSHIG